MLKLNKSSKIALEPHEVIAMGDSSLEFELKSLQEQKNILNRRIVELDTDIIGIKEELRKRRIRKIEEAQLVLLTDDC